MLAHFCIEFFLLATQQEHLSCFSLPDFLNIVKRKTNNCVQETLFHLHFAVLLISTKFSIIFYLACWFD